MFHKRVKQKEEGAAEHHFGHAAKALEAERARSVTRETPRQTAQRDQEKEQRREKEEREIAPFAATVTDPDTETCLLYTSIPRGQKRGGQREGKREDGVLKFDHFEHGACLPASMANAIHAHAPRAEPLPWPSQRNASGCGRPICASARSTNCATTSSSVLG